MKTLYNIFGLYCDYLLKPFGPWTEIKPVLPL